VELAGDLDKLGQTRAQLRSQMQASALMDEAGFARKVEAAYREMFGRWASGASKR
jgi:protein O-GlcNAc transferase